MPELRAFKPVSSAFDRTRKLLLEPFSAWLWLKLIVILFFVGGGGRSFNPGNAFNYSGGNSGDFTRESVSNAISSIMSNSNLLLIIALVILLIIALVLIFSFLRGVFSFVLIDALVSGDVQIIKPFMENLGRGFKVFLFNIAVMIVSLALAVVLLGGMLLAFLWMLSLDSNSSGHVISLLIAVGVILFCLLAFVVLSLVIGLVVGFFYDFGVPLMRFKNLGLIQSLSQVFGLVRKEPVEFLVYVILRWLLEFAIGLVFGIITLCVMAVFLVIGIALVLVFAAAIKASTWMWIPLIALIGIGLILLIIIVAIIAMPTGVYFRYYSLDFLRSFDQSYVPYSGRFGPEPGPSAPSSPASPTNVVP